MLPGRLELRPDRRQSVLEPGEYPPHAGRLTDRGQVEHARVASPLTGLDPIAGAGHPGYDGVEDLDRVDSAVRPGHQPEPPGRLVDRDRPGEWQRVPGYEGEILDRPARPGHVPVDDAGDPVALDPPVVGAGVVVAHDLPRRQCPAGLVPPRQRRVGPKGRHRVVEAAQPAHSVGQDGVRGDLAHRVDGPAREVRQDLPIAGVSAQHFRNTGEPARIEMGEQRVDGRRPPPDRPPDRRSDPDRAADVAEVQGGAIEQPLPQRGDEGQLRGEPVDVVELLGTEPSDRVVLVRNRLAGPKDRLVDPENESTIQRMLSWYSAYDLDFAAELLADLAYRGGFLGLAWVDLAARELPAPGELGRMGPPGGQHPGVPHDRDPGDHAVRTTHRRPRLRENRPPRGSISRRRELR